MDQQQSTPSTSKRVYFESSNPQPSTSNTRRTAQNEYIDALNFKEDSPLDGSQDTDQNTSKMKNMMSNMLKSINNSRYIYPAITIAVMVIFVIIVLFQSSTVSKVLSVILLLLFIVFTIYYTKN